MTNLYGNPIVEWPKHYKPLPEGYCVVFVDSYYKWVNEELDLEGLIYTDRYRARRCAFAHYEKCLKETKKQKVQPPYLGDPVWESKNEMNVSLLNIVELMEKK